MRRIALAAFAFALALASLGILADSARAQSSRESGFDLLRMEPSARAAALAGTVGPVESEDPTAVYYNPALLTDAMHRGLSLGYLNHLADVNAGFVSYARTLPRVGTLAVGVRFLSYGSFEYADEGGVRNGSTFGASEAALSVTVSRELTESLRGGATVHAAFATIEEASAQALAADLGVRYEAPGGFGVSASVHHLGTTLNSLGETTDDRLPLDFRLGVAKRLAHIPLTISLMGYNLHSYDGDGSALDEALRHVAIGGEFRFGQPVSVRFGYNPRRHEELSDGGRLDLAGVTAGFGINLRRVVFDYAYNAWSSFGGLHQLSVRTRI